MSLERGGIGMTKNTFNLAAALETLRASDPGALDEFLLEAACDGNVGAVDALLNAGATMTVGQLIAKGPPPTQKTATVTAESSSRCARQGTRPIDPIRAALKALQQG